jgi:hypothetical protein
MIYVLVVVSYFSGMTSGQTVTFQEFNTKLACENVLIFLKENRFSRYSHDNYKFVCVPKG